MSTCLVTVRHADREWDLELPAEIPAPALVGMLERALALPPGPPLHLVLEPHGALLRETLASAGVLDGARLVLTPEPRHRAAAEEGPALGWRPLSEPGYTWKRLEE